ncbi:MAG: dihydroxyacetone kinase subunit DhaL [Candidatus Limnocylindrales bacterium]
MSAALVVAWLERAAERIHERRGWLTDLDAAIGDGDHGINLDRGFDAIRERLSSGAIAADSAGLALAGAGRTILGTVGGASGALYGRAFQRAGERIVAIAPGAGSGGEPLGAVEIAVEALTAASDAIAALGRSRAGEKTMLDALLPALAALRASHAASEPVRLALDRAAAAAEAGAIATIPLIARKGRASYLGERSIGHEDPGAASSALLLAALAEVVRERDGVDEELRFRAG